jgi:hypothetical protein
MKACSTLMDARSTSEGVGRGEGDAASAALLDRALFEPYLLPGERILWAGRPGLSRGRKRRIPEKPKRQRQTEVALFVFCIVMLSVTFGFKAAAKYPNWSWGKSLLAGAITASLTFGTMAVLLSLLALVLVAVRFVLSPFHRRALTDTSYALTNFRAMALQRSQSGALSMASYDSANNPQAMLREDGSGDVMFGYKGGLFPRWGSRRTPNASRLVMENIDEGARVYSLVQATLEERTLPKAQLLDAAP